MPELTRTSYYKCDLCPNQTADFQHKPLYQDRWEVYPKNPYDTSSEYGSKTGPLLNLLFRGSEFHVSLIAHGWIEFGNALWCPQCVKHKLIPMLESLGVAIRAILPLDLQEGG